MAKTYTAASISTTFGSNKSLLALYNGSASRVVKLQRVWALGNQITALVGCLTQLVLRRISAVQGGVEIVPTEHNSSNSASDLTGITCVTAASCVSTGGPIQSLVWNTDEVALSAASTEEFQVIVPLFMLTYPDDFGQIVIPQGGGVHLEQPGINSNGFIDVFFEFTVETI